MEPITERVQEILDSETLTKKPISTLIPPGDPVVDLTATDAAVGELANRIGRLEDAVRLIAERLDEMNPEAPGLLSAP